VQEALALVKLQEYGRRYPKQLSGGQQQRVALARAFIFKPPVLLMDEPLGALDKKLREHMQLEIKHLHEELGLTVIYVTHDQSEALTMSDKVVLLNLGKIEQLGKPDELYEKPQNKFVADFIGETNLLAGKVLKKEGDVVFVQTHKGVRIEAVCRSDIRNEDVNISLRPEKVVLITGETQPINSYSAILEDIIYLGETTKFKLILEGQGEEIFLKLQNRKGVPKLARGEVAKVGWDSDDMTVF
jgi:ABC-type Fe3+/spermidine/putrescine transport system ATPase subunit